MAAKIIYMYILFVLLMLLCLKKKAVLQDILWERWMHGIFSRPDAIVGKNALSNMVCEKTSERSARSQSKKVLDRKFRLFFFWAADKQEVGAAVPTMYLTKNKGCLWDGK